MSRPAEREFTHAEGFVFFLAYIGIQLASETFNQWGVYFYSPPEGTTRIVFVPIAIAGFIFLIGTIWDAITDPLVGSWSDLTRPEGRWRMVPLRGRRRPFIFWGSILMTFTFIGAWYPPVEGTSLLNFAYGTAMICLHWTFFTITTVPVLALGPEIARSEQARVRLGLWIAGGFIAGLAIANALSGLLVTLLDTAPEGMPTSPTGYRRLAVIYALITLGVFQIAAWTLRERYVDPTPDRQDSFLKGYAGAAGNRPFVIFCLAFFFFTTGLLAVQRILSYWVEVGLGGTEDTVTLLLVPYILSAIAGLALTPFIARRLHSKWTMVLCLFIMTATLPWMYLIGTLEVSAQTKTLCGMLLFSCSGLGQGILYVISTPMLGEIIDYDAARSGERREALYNGLYGVAWKASMAGSILLATQSMHRWGNTAEQPLGIYLVGPIAGALGLLGIAALLFYPSDLAAHQAQSAI